MNLGEYEAGWLETDDRGWYGPPGQVIAYLPHSCDEWVIGGAEAMRLLIADLQAALAKAEAQK